MKILLAEDNSNDVELTLMALEEQRLAREVVVVRDGVEALDYLHRRGKYSERTNDDPVVALLDLKMPKVDGLQVLREMKADPVLRHVPAVILTTSREPRDLIESYNIGVNGYVVKPVGFDQFMEAIRRIALFWVLTNERPRRAELT
jgi:CheY-like chemotaxis protein